MKTGLLAWKWSAKIAIQIASALEKAHKNKIIHRDIKPHNIIITEDGIAKVTDFGIAKAVSNATITAFGATIGSVHYFSPEHARGGHTDEKSDIYSLGVVLYEMVTGKVPFDGDTPVAVALKHMQDEPSQPIDINSDLPISINNIVVKAMQKEGINRYSSATEMIRDLNAALKNPDSSAVGGAGQNDFATQVIGVVPEVKREESGRRRKKGKFSKVKEFFGKHPVLKWLTILLSAGILFASVVGITLHALNAGRVEQVVLPNLVNETLEDAKEIAEDLGLALVVREERYHPEIEEGKIIEQDPRYQSNFRVNRGFTIMVDVSKGRQYVNVPHVTGISRDEAEELLREVRINTRSKGRA